jgi:hypothetical protein
MEAATVRLDTPMRPFVPATAIPISPLTVRYEEGDSRQLGSALVTFNDWH